MSRLLFCLAFLILPSLLVAQTDPDYRYKVSDQVANIGDSFEASVSLDSSSGQPLLSLGVAIRHDPTRLTLDPVIQVGDSLELLNGGAGPEFFAPIIVGNGFGVGILIDTNGNETLPPSADAEIVKATYTSLLLPGETTGLEFDSAFTAQDNSVGTATGAFSTPVTFDGLVAALPSTVAGDPWSISVSDGASFTTTDVFPMAVTLFAPPGTSGAAIRGWDLTIDYDEALLELVAVEAGNNHPRAGELCASCLGESEWSVSETLADDELLRGEGPYQLYVGWYRFQSSLPPAPGPLLATVSLAASTITTRDSSNTNQDQDPCEDDGDAEDRGEISRTISQLSKTCNASYNFSRQSGRASSELICDDGFWDIASFEVAFTFDPFELEILSIVSPEIIPGFDFELSVSAIGDTITVTGINQDIPLPPPSFGGPLAPGLVLPRRPIQLFHIDFETATDLGPGATSGLDWLNLSTVPSFTPLITFGDGSTTIDPLFIDGSVGSEPAGGPQFVRGDTNQDDSVNLADGVFILNFLFSDGPDPSCLDTADANDDGSTNIADGVYILNFLFAGGPAPASPYPSCGIDPTADGLSCLQFGSCP